MVAQGTVPYLFPSNIVIIFRGFKGKQRFRIGKGTPVSWLLHFSLEFQLFLEPQGWGRGGEGTPEKPSKGTGNQLRGSWVYA